MVAQIFPRWNPLTTWMRHQKFAHHEGRLGNVESFTIFYFPDRARRLALALEMRRQCVNLSAHAEPREHCGGAFHRTALPATTNAERMTLPCELQNRRGEEYDPRLMLGSACALLSVAYSDFKKATMSALS